MKTELFVLVFCLCACQSLAFNGRRNTRVVGGREARRNQAPYLCSIQRDLIHKCGGAIISNKWILTAAHCLLNVVLPNMTVLVGTNDLDRGGVRYNIEKVINHEEFNDDYHDIGLIRIKGTIRFTSRVQSIQLSNESVPPNTTLEMNGWGYLEYDVHETPNKLQTINLKSTSLNECKRIYRRYAAYVVPEKQVCTSALKSWNQGVCNGDSGGPLVLRRKVVGIASSTILCAMWIPDLYTDVVLFADWVRDTIKDNSSN